jgi:signal transduction histidine kinase
MAKATLKPDLNLRLKKRRASLPMRLCLLFGVAVSLILYVMSPRHYERAFNQQAFEQHAAPGNVDFDEHTSITPLHAASYDMDGRHWAIVFKPSPGLVGTKIVEVPAAVAGAALLFVVVLLLYLRSAQKRSKHGGQLVATRSTELLAANRALEKEINERKRAQQHLVQAQKMEAIGQMTSGIAHDFNNHLMVIDLYTKRALRDINDMGAAGTALNGVLGATEKAAKLTGQLLVFSRREATVKRVFRAGEAMAELDVLLRHSVGESHDLSFSVEDEEACVATDPTELGQAIVNLAINARDAMPDGGPIDIGVRAVDLDEGLTSRRPGLSPGRYVAISVQDQGSGIENETLAHIFEPFFTTKGQGQGTGLGLAMVYGFAEQSRGFVDVVTAPARGSTFSIYLPVVDRPPELIAAEEEKEHRGKGETILLVEDDDRVLELTRDVLQDLGYNVLAAGSGLEALEKDEDYVGCIELLLSDVVMPSLGGFELYEILRKQRPDIRAVFMSGYPKREDRRNGPPQMSRFLQKPIETRLLARVLRSEIDSKEVGLFG